MTEIPCTGCMYRKCTESRRNAEIEDDICITVPGFLVNTPPGHIIIPFSNLLALKTVVTSKRPQRKKYVNLYHTTGSAGLIISTNEFIEF